MSQIVRDRSLLHDGTSLKNSNSTSTWVPTDHAAELVVELEFDSAGSATVSLDILFSRLGAKANNDGTPTTDDYISYNIVTSTGTKTMLRYTPTDVAALGDPPTSVAIKATETADVTATVYVWLVRVG
jgi:hypothetical protein